MQKVHRPLDKWRDVVFGGIALLIVIADQLSKIWIRANLEVGETLFDIGFFRIVYVQNTGAAFGIFKGHSVTLGIVSSIGIIIILLLVFIYRKRWIVLDRLTVRIALGLILGGTIGNLIDRLFIGFVTDFIDFKVWPVWNVADNAAVVGEIILAVFIIYMLVRAKSKT